ncbi:hypothetical protein [Pseudomonas fluorescens]|uniref:hypothetical protein n=1 Tax=Pseudomonas fluorescens TaxID=294 RepID=UPI001240E293|nr:hypothetical protein [Pseudomonas fluorescens]VVN23535.1 hypothetical protein PS639_04416 [Pseudomonas fluorescens]
MSVTYLPLEAWNKQWQIDGSRVRCRWCGKGQDLTEAGAFHHALGCKDWGRQAQYPGRELSSLLQQTIQVGLF